MKKVTTALLILLPFFIFAKVKVVGTIPDYTSIAKEIGGERVTVETLVKGTQDPHFADALPSHIIRLNRADLLISTGLGLESGWLPALLKNARNKKIQQGSEGFLEASRFVSLLDIPAKIDKSMGDVHPGGNPHFYTAPDQLFLIAKAVKNRLKIIDPQGKEYYEKQWTDFKTRYSQEVKKWKEKVKGMEGTRIVVYHESWVYLLKWLGFEKVGALEPKPGIPPSAGHVSRLLKRIKGKDVKFIFQEIYHPTSLSKVFSKKSGIRLLILPSMTGAQKDVKTIWDKFDAIINKITKGE